MEKKLIEMGKQYTTRDGEPVRIICTDREGDYPVVALIGEDEVIGAYDKYGSFYTYQTDNPYDLIEKSVERKIYLELFSFSSWSGDCSCIVHNTKQDLEDSISNNEEDYILLATKEITFTEGEFV